jgi:tRNA (Thr-GGU) A37 N-methylase
MTEPSIIYRPIGVIRSGHDVAERTPIQPGYARGCPGRAEVRPEYAEGLKDLDGFSSPDPALPSASGRRASADRAAIHG